VIPPDGAGLGFVYKVHPPVHIWDMCRWISVQPPAKTLHRARLDGFLRQAARVITRRVVIASPAISSRRAGAAIIPPTPGLRRFRILLDVAQKLLSDLASV
jgi:hypothetical protein